MLRLRLGQAIYSGCTMPHLHQKIFLDLSLLLEGAQCFGFDLAKLFFQGATMPPLHKFFSHVVGRGNMLLLRIIQVISSGSHHAKLTPHFLELSLLW